MHSEVAGVQVCGKWGRKRKARCVSESMRVSILGCVCACVRTRVCVCVAHTACICVLACLLARVILRVLWGGAVMCMPSYQCAYAYTYLCPCVYTYLPVCMPSPSAPRPHVPLLVMQVVVLLLAAVALVWAVGSPQAGDQQRLPQLEEEEGVEGRLAWASAQVWVGVRAMLPLLQMVAAVICSSLSPPHKALSLRWVFEGINRMRRKAEGGVGHCNTS